MNCILSNVRRMLIRFLWCAISLSLPALGWSDDLSAQSDLGTSDLFITGENVSLASAQQAFNTIRLSQIGVANTASLSQSGAGNVIELLQQGAWNTASVSENGINNRASIDQIGDSNSVGITFYSNNKFIEVRQFGNKLVSTAVLH